MGDAKLLDDRFERAPAFDLQRYARRSFGTFQEKSVRVVLRFDAAAAPDASSFLFHPNQTVDEQDDGTVTVSFEAGGLDEICWHLVTWVRRSQWKSPCACAGVWPACVSRLPDIMGMDEVLLHTCSHFVDPSRCACSIRRV